MYEFVCGNSREDTASVITQIHTDPKKAKEPKLGIKKRKNYEAGKTEHVLREALKFWLPLFLAMKFTFLFLNVPKEGERVHRLRNYFTSAYIASCASYCKKPNSPKFQISTEIEKRGEVFMTVHFSEVALYSQLIEMRPRIKH